MHKQPKKYTIRKHILDLNQSLNKLSRSIQDLKRQYNRVLLKKNLTENLVKMKKLNKSKNKKDSVDAPGEQTM